MLNSRNVFALISRGKLFILIPLFSFNDPPLIGVFPTDELSAIWIEEKVASFTHLLKNELCKCGLISMPHEYAFRLSNSCFAY